MTQTELITVKAAITPLLIGLERAGYSAAVVVDEELMVTIVVAGDVIEPETLCVGAEVLG